MVKNEYFKFSVIYYNLIKDLRKSTYWIDKKCGSCVYWMDKRNCKRERTSSVSGEMLKCKDFIIKPHYQHHFIDERLTKVSNYEASLILKIPPVCFELCRDVQH